MRLIADTTLSLPFALDFCARGPDVEPLVCTQDGWQVTLSFPPSLGADTDGQGMFGDWAWWTGRSLRLTLERAVNETGDLEALRAETAAVGEALLRSFLNAYRWRLNRPEVHPVRLDPRRLTLELVQDDGRRELLPEPLPAFLTQNRRSEPPLATTLNDTTLPLLQADVQQGQEPPLAEQVRLDADALDAHGEAERAAWLRRWMQKQDEHSA